ncbi:uncharacterized protein DNG_04635 [Cephalotrichum gorgonifer]|uniref:NAD dependent epimerase/dehydratase n=1 Tax=Cephalotrichum gorgonifer TaxID=2041049 RepID=A0AAE8MZD9_9PEZI|nr:uncharacterized protein DNG_04635 [Cephalotrichum gorgonifer]
MPRSRAIDAFPVLEHPREKKVIVLSYGRNGTLGLHNALQILGYNSYHVMSCVQAGASHLRVAREGMMARFDGVGKRYGREEFDRWFADNGALVDISAYFADDLVAAYPQAKFILTHREPSAWIRSVRNTLVPLEEATASFPIWHMSFVDTFTREFARTTRYWRRFMWSNPAGEEGVNSDEKAIEGYLRHNDRMKKIVPPEKLLVVKLEDGLGWEQICPFLGHEIPDEPYPRANNPKEFLEIVPRIIRSHWRKTLATYATVLAPVVAAGVWYAKGGR